MQNQPFIGLHYCNYGPGPEQIERLVAAGMVVEATADDADAEVLELPSNRFFMLSLFQPQIGALAGMPLHPLFREFVRCARQQVRSELELRPPSSPTSPSTLRAAVSQPRPDWSAQ